MRHRVWRFSLLLLLALAACSAGPPFAAVEATLPPLPQGESRIFFYRWLEPYETRSFSTVYLNGQPVGVSQPGAVFFRDVAPGTYFVSVFSPGRYPDQFKTIALAPGQVAYIRIASLRSWNQCSGLVDNCNTDTFVVDVMAPAAARAEMARLPLIRG